MHIYLTLAKLGVMVLGFLIAYEAYTGYRRSSDESMLYVSIGFVFISFGALLEGILLDAFGVPFHDAGTIATTIVGIGMLSVLYALYGNISR